MPFELKNLKKALIASEVSCDDEDYFRAYATLKREVLRQLLMNDITIDEINNAVNKIIDEREESQSNERQN